MKKRPTLITPTILDDLYGWLCQCASADKPCPTNNEICGRYGFRSISTSAKAIGKLEAHGRIFVLRTTTMRQVTIAVTGAKTAAIKTLAPVVASVGPVSKPDPRRRGRKGRQCQWIEGEPGPDDSSKCRVEIMPGKPYCPPHQARSRVTGAYVPDQYRVDTKRPAPS